MDPHGRDPQRADRLVEKPRRRSSISSQLRWSYLISSTIPLLLVGGLLTAVLFRVQQRNAYDSQKAVADQLAGNISTFLLDLEQQLLRASRELDPARSGPGLDEAASRVVITSPDLRTLTVLNRAGEVVARAGSELLDSRGQGSTPLNLALLQNAISDGRGGRTPITLGPDGQHYFQVVLPVRNPLNQDLVGALSAEVSVARLNQILRRAGQADGKVSYLIDAQRTLMLSSRSRGWSPPPDLQALFVDGQTATEYTGGDGTLLLGARSPISPIGADSWSVVVEQPSSDFFVEVYRSVFLLTALVALVGVLALSWALYQSRRIVDPVRLLTAGAQEFGYGHLEHRIRVEGSDELGTLATTFNHMAGRLQSSLHEIEQQNERLRHGIELARDIQQGLLPSSPPWQTEILSVFARSLPASEVGGDFYTYLMLPGGQAAIAIGDISGKGVAAALLMALTSSSLESQARALDYPAAMLYALNGELRQRLQANQMNAALLIAVYHPERATMTIANAGMIAPLVAHIQPGGGVECHFVDVWGLPIGTLLDARYAEVEVPLGPGDTVLFLSDGIVEAHNERGELFGFERLEELVAGLPAGLSVAEVVQHILDAVLGFAGAAEPHDDITIIATRPTASAPASTPSPTPHAQPAEAL
jgi:serine phosphatase RsbU (regulator of sigma subunit)